LLALRAWWSSSFFFFPCASFKDRHFAYYVALPLRTFWNLLHSEFDVATELAFTNYIIRSLAVVAHWQFIGKNLFEFAFANKNRLAFAEILS